MYKIKIDNVAHVKELNALNGKTGELQTLIDLLDSIDIFEICNKLNLDESNPDNTYTHNYPNWCIPSNHFDEIVIVQDEKAWSCVSIIKIEPEYQQYQLFICETANKEDLSGLLRQIASYLDKGYSSGYYPTWEIKKVE